MLQHFFALYVHVHKVLKFFPFKVYQILFIPTAAHTHTHVQYKSYLPKSDYYNSNMQTKSTLMSLS